MVSDMDNHTILLASKSPRRQELMQLLDLKFEIPASLEVEETYPDSLPCEKIPEYLSQKKASAYKDSLKDNEILVTADTVVIIDSEILGKPHSELEAKTMLRKLSGNTHKVVTGVTITSLSTQKTFSSITEVDFDVLSDEEIEHYVKKYQPFDKAGAYGIQEWIGAVGIKAIRGSFYNVMGLPVHRLYKELNDTFFTHRAKAPSQ